MKRTFLTIVLVGFTLGMGCSDSGASDVLGEWHGSVEITPEGREKLGTLSSEQESMLEEQMANQTLVLDLRKGGQYSLTALGVTWEDTWRQEGNKIIIASRSFSHKMSSKDGQSSESVTPNKEPATLELSDDRLKLVSTNFDDGGSLRVTFSRKDKQ